MRHVILKLALMGILPPSMADRAVPIAPLAQTVVDVVLVGLHLRARTDRGPNQRLNRRLLDIIELHA